MHLDPSATAVIRKQLDQARADVALLEELLRRVDEEEDRPATNKRKFTLKEAITRALRAKPGLRPKEITQEVAKVYQAGGTSSLSHRVNVELNTMKNRKLVVSSQGKYRLS